MRESIRVSISWASKRIFCKGVERSRGVSVGLLVAWIKVLAWEVGVKVEVKRGGGVEVGGCC